MQIRIRLRADLSPKTVKVVQQLAVWSACPVCKFYRHEPVPKVRNGVSRILYCLAAVTSLRFIIVCLGIFFVKVAGDGSGTCLGVQARSDWKAWDATPGTTSSVSLLLHKEH